MPAANQVLVDALDELLLKLVSPMGLLGGYDILTKYHRQLLFATKCGLPHSLLLRYVIVYADKFKALPDSFEVLGNFIERQEKNEEPLSQLKALATINQQDVLWLYSSLELCVDKVYEEAVAQRHAWAAERYRKIVTVGLTDGKKRYWKGVADAQEWLRKEWSALPSEGDFEEEEAAPPKEGLRYPELKFPSEILPGGRFKELVDKACEGGLSPGLVVPAIMAYASAIPHQDSQEGARINLYVCLLALVGAGKDTAIDRARAVLGLDEGSSERIFTAYTPSGERSIATLIGDSPPTKNDPVARPGPRRHCIVTYELEDTLAKSRGETSSVLQAMQWFYDHNRKVFADSQRRQQQTVDCRLSWLTALPIGTGVINVDQFRHAFGESTSHGIASRFLFGFAEESFDRRKSRNFTVPHGFYSTIEEKTIGEGDAVHVEQTIKSTVSTLFTTKVSGFAPGVEELYYSWHPIVDYTGRDTYHVLKVAVITAILNLHTQIEQDDWAFAVGFMKWQSEIRNLFKLGKARKISQGEFNEVVIAEATKRTHRLMTGESKPGKNYKVVQEDGQTHYYVRWKAMVSDNSSWPTYGYDIERTIDALARGGAFSYLEEFEASPDGLRDKTSANRTWIRVVNLRGPHAAE